jgi:mannose-1-phosphate guanylyltransferase
MRCVIVMAGGSGQRFWPASRETYPKQFLTLYGNRSLLQYSYQRAKQITDPKCVYVSTRSGLESPIRKQLLSLRKDRLIVEPIGRDTAPSILLSCMWIQRRIPDATVMFLPADHYVSPTERFVRTAAKALSLAERTSSIIIIGITPSFSSTGYGYIQCDRGQRERRSPFSVLSFREKPDLKTAERYLKEGNYYWNSGIFAAKANVMMDQIRDHAPKIFKLAQPLFGLPESTFRAKLPRVFRDMPKISLDYAVMEKSKDVLMIPAEFEWNDLGCWASLEDLPYLRKGKNVSSGPLLSYDSQGNIVSAGERLVTLVDVENLVVALTEDALLICRKDSAQKVKQVVTSLKQGKHSSYV